MHLTFTFLSYKSLALQSKDFRYLRKFQESWEVALAFTSLVRLFPFASSYLQQASPSTWLATSASSVYAARPAVAGMCHTTTHAGWIISFTSIWTKTAKNPDNILRQTNNLETSEIMLAWSRHRHCWGSTLFRNLSPHTIPRPWIFKITGQHVWISWQESIARRRWATG